MRHRRALLLGVLLLAGALAGCSAWQVATSLVRTEEIRLEPIRSVDKQFYKDRLFFAEYLRESGETTQRVAVLAEELRGPLHLILNPSEYVSGETGAETLPNLAKRLRPLRLHAVLGRGGRRLGYAFLPSGRTLRLAGSTRGRYTLDLVSK